MHRKNFRRLAGVQDAHRAHNPIRYREENRRAAAWYWKADGTEQRLPHGGRALHVALSSPAPLSFLFLILFATI